MVPVVFLVMVIATISGVYNPFLCHSPSVTWVMMMALLHIEACWRGLLFQVNWLSELLLDKL